MILLVALQHLGGLKAIHVDNEYIRRFLVT